MRGTNEDASILVISSAALLFVVGVHAAALENVTIRRCYDGDTCTTSTGEKIRLACIDTPEMRGKRAQPQRARAARDHLQAMAMTKKIQIRTKPMNG